MTAHLKVEKVQHPIKLRLLEVVNVSELSPSMRRITLSGEDLKGFHSGAFDDHVKLFVPDQVGEKPVMPTLGEKGLVFPEDKAKPAMRDYTPRRYDPVKNELEVDFVLDHEGPATDWANQAKPGHYLGVAGPRGSFVVPTAFDWHLLIGDETAIPAIGRRLEELPATTKAIVVIKTLKDSSRIALTSQCPVEEYWVSEESQTPTEIGILEGAVRQLRLPEGEGFVWAGGEYNDIKAVRQYIVDELGIDKSRVRASSYWRATALATHEQFND